MKGSVAPARILGLVLVLLPAWVTPEDSAAPATLPVNGSRAFFIIFQPMLDSPDWPSAYEDYRGGVVVMNPFNASKATVSKVRRDLGVKVLMYYDTQDIQIHTPTGKCLNPTPNKICTDRDAATGWTRCASGAMPCCFSHECNAYTSTACPEDDYARALASAFDAKWCVNELTPSPPATAATKAMITGAVANAAAAAAAADERVPVCAYGKGPLGCHSAQSNAAMVPFLADWIAGHGYDGVYFDEYFKAWTRTFPFPVDTDGDGKADTPAETRAQYDKYRPAFSAALRKALGPNAIMVANSDVGQVDPSLNGLTIEACDDAAECVAAFAAQAAVAHPPLLSVMWLKGADPAECAIAKEMRAKLPYLLEGTDFYDGTHVVC